jgi:hypothetical protein
MYKLTKEEKNKLPDFWKFIDIFLIKYDIHGEKFLNGVYTYRLELIDKVRNLYKPEEFYFYETILNKLLWNLFEKLDFTIKYFINKENSKVETIESYIYLNPSPRSYSHKLFLENMKSNKKYFLNQYTNIIDDNPLLRKIFTVMTNEKLYNKVIKDPSYIKKIKNAEIYYYPYDYVFPNINFIFYNENPKSVWIKNIKKLYYFNKGKSKSKDEGWYKYNSIKI